MISKSSIGRLVALLGLSVLANGVVAQSVHVSQIRIDWNSWRFKPLYTEDGGVNRVTGFLAIADQSAVTGENIVAVWYSRESTQDWSKRSWTTDDVASVIKSMKISLGIPDSEDENWEINQSVQVLPTDAPLIAKEYDKGLFVDDPLYNFVASSDDPVSLVAFLDEVGYKVADIKIDHPASCTVDAQLEVMARAVENGLAIVVTDEESSKSQTEAMAAEIATLAACQPAVTPACTPGVTGPWVLGAVVGPKGCSWSVTDTWTAVTAGRAYTCSYEYCCTYTRTRSAPAVKADCSVYTCTQIEFQKVCSTAVVCGPIFVANPIPPAVWMAPCGTSPLCSTTPPVVPGPPAIVSWTWSTSSNCP
jgi:hypothetical protein